MSCSIGEERSGRQRVGGRTAQLQAQRTVHWGEPERAPHIRVCCGISLY